MAWEQYAITDSIVSDYKDGIPGSAEKLLECFNGFTDKYKNLIVNGTPCLSNRSIRQFITIFVKGESKLYLYKKSSTAVAKATIAASRIQSIFSVYDADEIDNILALTLLEMATKYKALDDKPRFHAYVLSIFHFRLYENLVALTKDPANAAMVNDSYLHANSPAYSNVDDYTLQDQRIPGLLLTENDINVDDNWVMGLTADVFADLNQIDRKILKMKYVDKKNDGDIADELSVCRATVNRRRIKIEKDIEEYLVSRHMMKG